MGDQLKPALQKKLIFRYYFRNFVFLSVLNAFIRFTIKFDTFCIQYVQNVDCRLLAANETAAVVDAVEARDYVWIFILQYIIPSIHLGEL